MEFTPEDFDFAVRTVYGEASQEPAIGQQGVAAVIRNRATQSGRGIGDVVTARSQFEPWETRRDELLSLDPSSPQYQAIANNIRPVFTGEVEDPTGGADHFLSPGLMAQRGDQLPAWAQGPGQDIGRHRFFKLGYRGGGIKSAGTEAAATGSGSPADQAKLGAIPGEPPLAVTGGAAPQAEQQNALAAAGRGSGKQRGNALSNAAQPAALSLAGFNQTPLAALAAPVSRRG